MGIVHRDIKPSNFLLTQRHGEQVVKLTDFGLSLDTRKGEDSKLTKPGTTLGTVDYMAPEQARGGPNVDIRSDIYGLGCTTYHMLTGRAPFPDGMIPEKLYKHVHHYPTDPRELHPGLPDEVITLLGKMLEKRPEDRYQTPAELLRDLERLAPLRALQPRESPVVASDRTLRDVPVFTAPNELPALASDTNWEAATAETDLEVHLPDEWSAISAEEFSLDEMEEIRGTAKLESAWNWTHWTLAAVMLCTVVALLIAGLYFLS
jgi:serine/threonine protein kinase